MYTNGPTMKHVGIKQAREAHPEQVHRAEAGEEIAIPRQGKAVPRLVGAPRAPRAPNVLPTLREFRRSLGRDGTAAARLAREERDSRQLGVRRH